MFVLNIRRFALLMVAFLSCAAPVARAQNVAQIGSWGDQGDGTYKNPVLNGDYPDVDIEQVGDSYYLITSTNHYAPAMSILESKDLGSRSGGRSPIIAPHP